MATAIVRHRVTNFTDWKNVFDDVEGFRRADGMTAWNIYTAAEDDNDVTAVLEFDTLDHAKAHFQNPELKSAMQRAGVTSKPDIVFLEAR